MVTDGADGGGLLADDDVAAVGALPDAVALAGEDDAVLDVLQELAVALLVLFLDLAHHAEFGGNLLEAFFFRFLRHAGVHVRPLEVLAGSGIGQVLHGRGHAVVQVLEPDLCVFLLVGRGLLEDLGDLHIAVLLGFGRVVGVLVASHGLAGESLLEVLFGLGSFEVHNMLLISGLKVKFFACLRPVLPLFHLEDDCPGLKRPRGVPRARGDVQRHDRAAGRELDPLRQLAGRVVELLEYPPAEADHRLGGVGVPVDRDHGARLHGVQHALRLVLRGVPQIQVHPQAGRCLRPRGEVVQQRLRYLHFSSDFRYSSCRW